MDEFSELRGAKIARPRPVAKRGADDNTRRLREVVDEIVGLEERKRAVSADIKVIYEAAKSSPWSAKAIKEIVKREMEDFEKRAAREAVASEVATLTAALGAFAMTPLGESAMSRAGAG